MPPCRNRRDTEGAARWARPYAIRLAAIQDRISGSPAKLQRLNRSVPYLHIGNMQSARGARARSRQRRPGRRGGRRATKTNRPPVSAAGTNAVDGGSIDNKATLHKVRLDESAVLQPSRRSACRRGSHTALRQIHSLQSAALHGRRCLCTRCRRRP